jgi:hypothetical protein
VLLLSPLLLLFSPLLLLAGRAAAGVFCGCRFACRGGGANLGCFLGSCCGAASEARRFRCCS